VTRGKSIGDGAQRGLAAGLNLPNDRQHVGGKTIGGRAIGCMRLWGRFGGCRG
jgi:hypothetical protein